MTGAHSSYRFEVRSAQHLAELAAAPLPQGLAEGAAVKSRHRDIYLDTADDSLRRRGVTCRLRLSADDTRLLSLFLDPAGDTAGQRFHSPVDSTDATIAASENTEAGRRLRALVDPARLEARLEIETDRTTRFADRDWLRRPCVAIRYDRRVARRGDASGSFHGITIDVLHGDGASATALASAMESEHGLRTTGQTSRERAELVLKWKRGPQPEIEVSGNGSFSHPAPPPTPFLNPELSLLAFQSRVLTLAESSEVPLHERLRFLSIVSSNIDEFFMIRVAGLRQAAEEQSGEQCDDGLTRAAQMHMILAAIDRLALRQSACAAGCLRELEQDGVRIVKWADLEAGARSELRQQCIDEIHPDLTPMAMTLSPGHPMPHLPHLTLALAVARRDPHTKRLHLAELELPSDASRFFRVPGTVADFITLEEVVRANIDLVHPAGGVEAVFAFRVTRGGELTLDEEAADDLVEAVSSASERRTSNPAVRIEVERGTPQFIRDLLITNLQAEDPLSTLGAADIREVDGLLDLTCLSRLDVPYSSSRKFPPFEPAAPLAESSMFEAMGDGDLLFHHPFDSFADTVLRFLEEAADDPDVTTIRITLYRLGSSSAVADALIRAAKRGKKVIAFVELKARFDEEHNVGWARKLEKAGGHVISGLVGVKNHAKAAMVVRREGGRLKSYVHVGTGNYNSRSAREYTDLSLLSTRDDVALDVNDLFNSLTGGSLPPRGLSRGALVAPHQMADALIAMVDREASNARSGMEAKITVKVNGLSDPGIVRALLRASGDGVAVTIICRGICTLRPGMPGVSDRVRIISHVGRFLEHSRVYRFSNGGEPVHYIGSADLRHRNLRKRVELLVPVTDGSQKEELDHLLDSYIADPTAWELSPDGEYRQRQPGAAQAQMSFVRRGTARVQ